MKKAPLPTVTLATLYEEQENYVEALALYSIINKNHNNLSISKKIEKLKDKIYKKDKLNFDKTVTSIFSKQQIKMFNVLPEAECRRFRQVLDLEDVPIEEEKIDPIKEQKDEKKVKKQTFKIDLPLSDFAKVDNIAESKIENEKRKKKERKENNSDLTNLKDVEVIKLLEAAQDYYGDEKKVNEMTLYDLIALSKKMEK